jgi:hypothetical protein
VVAAVVALISGALLVWPRSALWLDEAQSVAIARLGLPGMVDGLKADGAPPVYYVLLYAWMRLFGDGDVAVRSLSIMCAVAAAAVLWIVATRAFGRRGGMVALLFTVSHPYFVRYATETRMYALVMLEVCLGALALQGWVRTQRRGWLAGLTFIACLLPLTHYWGFSLVVACGACTGVLAVRDVRRGRARGFIVATVAILVGLGATAVWWPVLRYQSQHTGTPWTDPSGPFKALAVTIHRGIGAGPLPLLLSAVLCVLALIGAVEATVAVAHQGDQAQGTRRWLTAVLGLTLVLSYAVTRLTASGFVARYTMTMFPLYVLLAVGGALVALRGRALMAVALAAWSTGAIVSFGQVDDLRTRAESFAAALAAEAHPGDVVVYCPDQLGPPVDRLLDQRHVALPNQLTYPLFARPDRVDWVDYAQRTDESPPGPFAAQVLRRAGNADVWLVLSVTHPPTQAACAGLAEALRAARPHPEVRIPDDPAWREHDSLLRFSPREQASEAAR